MGKCAIHFGCKAMCGLWVVTIWILIIKIFNFSKSLYPLKKHISYYLWNHVHVKPNIVTHSFCKFFFNLSHMPWNFRMLGWEKYIYVYIYKSMCVFGGLYHIINAKCHGWIQSTKLTKKQSHFLFIMWICSHCL